MPDRSSSQRRSQRSTPSGWQSRGRGDGDAPRSALARAIPRRPRVSWWLGLVLALGFAALVTPAITVERWLVHFDVGTIAEKHAAPLTVRAPMIGAGVIRVGGGVVIARGEIATRDEAALADAIAAEMPRGPVLYAAFFALAFALGALFTHHLRRSTKGRLIRVQVVSLALIAVLAALVKLATLATALSALVVPIAVLAMVPTMVLDRVVGLATGVLAALVISLQAPFDIGLALLLLVQAAAAGLVIPEGSKRRWVPALTAGLVTTLCTTATYLLVSYLVTGRTPELSDPLHSPWLAAAIGPALAAVLAAPLTPLYQLLVGEITQGKLIALEDLGHPLLRQIAEKSPGTWQHSLMMANMAEIAANAIGANGRLVRVGAYYHDLGKSLQPKYFIENLEAGETSPHDLLPPEVSCDAIFAHVTEGLVAARKAGLHERIVDFMHMHHGNGVLEYFWAKCREQGNPHGLTIEQFRYPGHPPQSRETALLAICDAVEAASRTLTKPDAAAIDSLVQRIVYGKLHLGQLDESGLSMSDLRRISDSLRETIRHANHGRIEYPWQKAGQDASASAPGYSSTAPRLDSLDRQPRRDSARHAARRPGDSDVALAATDDVRGPSRRSTAATEPGDGRVRLGTARNAPTAEGPAASEPAALARREPPAEGRVISPATLTGRAPGPLLPTDEPRVRSTDLTERLDRSEHFERPAHAGGAVAAAPSAHSDAGIARAFEPSAVAVDTPVEPVVMLVPPGAATHDPPAGDASPPRREPMTTLPGPAPGPALRPEPVLAGDAPAAARTPEPVRPAGPPAEASRARPPSGPPPVAARTPEPVRPAGPPAPVEPADAIAGAPPKRAPAGQPALPTDPTQLASALASLVARVSDAPFGKPTSAEAAAVTQPTIAASPAAAPAIAAAERRDADADASAGDAATPHGALAPRMHPPTPPFGHPPRSPIARSRIATEDRRSGLLKTLRGHVDKATALRRPAAPVPATRAPDPAGPASVDDARVTAPRAATAPPAAHDDASVTEPSLPVLAVGDQMRVDVPVRAAPEPSPPPPPDWAEGLAARIDAALDSDEWGPETPIVPPTKAALRALLGQPDPTKPQAIADLERLQRRAAELRDPALPRRSPHPTTEVDPDDIEAAIEVAPPARRPTSHTKPRKPE